MAAMSAICPHCQTENTEGAAVCVGCATPLPGEFRIRVSDHTAIVTAASPRSLKEWASDKSGAGVRSASGGQASLW